VAQITIELQSKVNQILMKKLDLLKEDEIGNSRMMYAIHNTLAKRCDPYVPFLEGPLSQTAVVTSESVRYIQPYARYQYYGDDFNHTLEYHPLASARWDEAMMRDRGDEFVQEVEEIIRERVRQDGSR